MVIQDFNFMNLKKNFFGNILFFFSIALMIYTFYRSEIIWEGNKRYYYNIYYLISFLVFFLSISLNYFNKKIITYIFIVLISFGAGLYSYEGYLYLSIKKAEKMQKKFEGSVLQKKKIYEENTGKEFERRSIMEAFSDEKEIDPNIKVPIFPYLHLWNNEIIFPFSGFSNSKTIHCKENGYYTFYRSDRYGFNNPDTEWDEKVIEFYLLGDSFAHGACVNENFNIASQLRNLTKKSVINLGYGGNGPLIEFASLKEYMQGDVKKIIWLYYEENDLDNLRGELQDNILINYLKDPNFSQNLIENQTLIDALAYKKLNKAEKIEQNKKKIENSLLKKRQERIIFYEFFKFIKLYQLRRSLRNTSTISEFEKILKLTKNLSLKKNSQLYFVYLPEYSRYMDTKFSNENYYKIKKILNRLNIPLIDIHEKVFMKEKDPLELFPFKLYGHYTPEGYKKISEIIHLETNKN